MKKYINQLLKIILITHLATIRAMEQAETENIKEKKYKIFFLSNNSKERLSIEIQDSEGSNLTNSIFADDAENIENPDAADNKWCVTLKPKCSAFAILFNDIQEHANVKFPLTVILAKNCIPEVYHILLSFKVNKCDDRKNFILEKELIYSCGSVLAWNCCVYKIDQINKSKWPQCTIPMDAFNNKLPLTNDLKFTPLLIASTNHIHDPGDKLIRMMQC